MATPSPSPHAFSIRVRAAPASASASSSSLAASIRLKTLIHNFVFSHLYRLARALTKAKTIILHLFKQINLLDSFILKRNKNKNKLKLKLYFGSFRLHYNWCSSHIVPITSPNPFNGHVYYDSSWNINSFVDDESQLSGYLQWLEEKNMSNSDTTISVDEMNEIDRLADKFIANCHEKFRLEKQESYRRFQEMMARSV